MSAGDHLSDLQFKFTAARIGSWAQGAHQVDALTAEGSRVGRISWEPHNGRVESIKVEPNLRRQGIGTRLWHEAHANAKQSDLAAPKHSDVQFPDGQAWIAGMARKDYQARQASRVPIRPKKSPPDENQGSLF